MLHPLSSAGGCLVLLISLIFLMVGGDVGRSASSRSAHSIGPEQDGMYIWVFCSSNALFPAPVKHGVVGPSLISGDSFLPSFCTFFVLNYKVGGIEIEISFMPKQLAWSSDCKLRESPLPGLPIPFSHLWCCLALGYLGHVHLLALLLLEFLKVSTTVSLACWIFDAGIGGLLSLSLISQLQGNNPLTNEENPTKLHLFLAINRKAGLCFAVGQDEHRAVLGNLLGFALSSVWFNMVLNVGSGD